MYVEVAFPMICCKFRGKVLFVLLLFRAGFVNLWMSFTVSLAFDKLSNARLGRFLPLFCDMLVYCGVLKNALRLIIATMVRSRIKKRVAQRRSNKLAHSANE